MSWRDKLRPASFRGVEFWVEVAAGDGGRMVVAHKVPGSEKAPFIEDMGFDGAQHNIEAFVIGDDYMAQRDRMFAALNQPGPGPLMHPTLGARTVSLVQRYSWREEQREGRLCHFTLPFADSAPNALPAATTDTGQAAKDAATGVTGAGTQALGKKFSVANKPQWVADLAKSKMQQLDDALTTARNAFPTIPASVTQFVSQAQGVSSTVASLIRAPLDLGAAIVGLVAAVALLPQQPRDALDMLKAFFGFGDDDSLPDTGSNSREQANANATAVNSLVKQAALAESARLLPSVTFSSSADIALVRKSLLDGIEEQLLASDDDDSYQSLLDLRGAVMDHLDRTAAQLPEVIKITPQSTQPALVLAYRQYQDATRDQEIVDRNHVQHPGFLIGGTEIEVLNG